MTKRTPKPADRNERAAAVVAQATGSAQSWDGANTRRWWDTGHTSKGCPDCGHHWDVHTPFRGCGSFCSCRIDPPNQPSAV